MSLGSATDLPSSFRLIMGAYTPYCQIASVMIPWSHDLPALERLALRNSVGVDRAKPILLERSPLSIYRASQHACPGAAIPDLAGYIIPAPPQLDALGLVAHHPFHGSRHGIAATTRYFPGSSSCLPASSFPSIGEQFDRDHSTVIHAFNLVEYA